MTKISNERATVKNNPAQTDPNKNRPANPNPKHGDKKPVK